MKKNLNDILNRLPDDLLTELIDNGGIKAFTSLEEAVKYMDEQGIKSDEVIMDCGDDNVKN